MPAATATTSSKTSSERCLGCQRSTLRQHAGEDAVGRWLRRARCAASTVRAAAACSGRRRPGRSTRWSPRRVRSLGRHGAAASDLSPAGTRCSSLSDGRRPTAARGAQTCGDANPYRGRRARGWVAGRPGLPGRAALSSRSLVIVSEATSPKVRDLQRNPSIDAIVVDPARELGAGTPCYVRLTGTAEYGRLRTASSTAWPGATVTRTVIPRSTATSASLSVLKPRMLVTAASLDRG